MSGAIIMRIKGLEQRIDELRKELEIVKGKVPKADEPKRRGRPPRVREEDAGPREIT